MLVTIFALFKTTRPEKKLLLMVKSILTLYAVVNLIRKTTSLKLLRAIMSTIQCFALWLVNFEGVFTTLWWAVGEILSFDVIALNSMGFHNIFFNQKCCSSMMRLTTNKLFDTYVYLP